MNPVVIVGGGPAGMMLGWQLAANGIAVHVVERHADFQREFRGELIQPIVLEVFRQQGILAKLVDRGAAIVNVERRLFVGPSRRVSVPGGGDKGALISQAGFLQLMHDACSKFAHVKMDFSTTALSFIRSEGAVTGIRVRRESGESEIAASLVVVCNGRNSALRKEAQLSVDVFQQPADVLWLRFDFSDALDARPRGVDVHMWGGGVVTVFFPTTNGRMHVAYSAPGDMVALKRDPDALRSTLLPFVPPALRSHVEKKLASEIETQVLKVGVDRLQKWFAPGILFIGDAAHTMSPAGGLGLNQALRDAIVASNHVIPELKEGRVPSTTVLEKIQEERRGEIEMLQAMQTRIGRAVMPPRIAQHLMFTMLGLVMKLRGGKMGMSSLPVVQPQFPANLSL